MVEKQIIFKDSVMVDENKFLNLGNLNDKIAYDLKNGKLEKNDFTGDNKLLQIFNFFDN
jgi:hypothetical protein